MPSEIYIVLPFRELLGKSLSLSWEVRTTIYASKYTGNPTLQSDEQVLLMFKIFFIATSRLLDLLNFYFITLKYYCFEMFKIW